MNNHARVQGIIDSLNDRFREFTIDYVEKSGDQDNIDLGFSEFFQDYENQTDFVKLLVLCIEGSPANLSELKTQSLTFLGQLLPEFSTHITDFQLE